MTIYYVPGIDLSTLLGYSYLILTIKWVLLKKLAQGHIIVDRRARTWTQVVWCQNQALTTSMHYFPSLLVHNFSNVRHCHVPPQVYSSPDSVSSLQNHDLPAYSHKDKMWCAQAPSELIESTSKHNPSNQVRVRRNCHPPCFGHYYHSIKCSL